MQSAMTPWLIWKWILEKLVDISAFEMTFINVFLGFRAISEFRALLSVVGVACKWPL